MILTIIIALKGGAVETRNDFIRDSLDSYSQQLIHKPVEAGQTLNTANVRRLNHLTQAENTMNTARHSLKTSSGVKFRDQLRLDDSEKMLLDLNASNVRLNSILEGSKRGYLSDLDDPLLFVSAMRNRPDSHEHLQKMIREVGGFVSHANELWRMQNLDGSGADNEMRKSQLDAMKSHLAEVSCAYFHITNALQENSVGLDAKEIDGIAIDMGGAMQKILTLMKNETLFKSVIEKARVGQRNVS